MNSKILIVFLFISITFFGQDIKKHQWKNRVLLVISDDTNSHKFKNQLEILEKKKIELLERKLVIYEVSINEFHFNFSKKGIQSTKLFYNFNKNKVPFLTVLIGLDGEIKLEQDSFLSTEKLFTIIDGMPMRRSEIRNNK